MTPNSFPVVKVASVVKPKSTHEGQDLLHENDD